MLSSKCFLSAVILVVSTATASYASIETTVDYGSDESQGLAAQAIFSLATPTQLQIHLRNTSFDPFGMRNGDAAMVLSSINFDLPGVLITGGSVALGSAKVVKNVGNAWVVDTSYGGNLNAEYGYSNKGVGNNTGSAILSDITALQVNQLLDGAVTSHTNGGKSVTRFNGQKGPLSGGLDFGLVALGSQAFGSKRFVLDGVILTLNLSGAGLTDLSFLETGSYVEFGSDYAYVGGRIPPPPPPAATVPEATSIAVWAILVGLGAILQKNR